MNSFLTILLDHRPRWYYEYNIRIWTLSLYENKSTVGVDQKLKSIIFSILKLAAEVSEHSGTQIGRLWFLNPCWLFFDQNNCTLILN